MSTRAEQFRYADERRHDKEENPNKRSSRSGEPGEHPRARVAKNAVFALEPRSNDGTPSRKSTRASANRSRSDHGLLMKESMIGNSPEAVYARSRAH